MSIFILRRRRLGSTSCREISRNSSNNIFVIRNDSNNINQIRTDDLVIRWGCTSNINTDSVINTSMAIHEVNNKLEFRRLLNEHELCPATAFNCPTPDFPFPVIIRPSRHAQGRNLQVCNTEEELLNSRIRLRGNYYVSELINKVAEYRVFVAHGRAVWVANKIPGNPEDVAWNVARGGRFENVRWYDWPLKAVKTSIEAFNLTSLDFGGVDVMVDSGGNCFVLEINSAPSLTSPYRQACTAKVMDYFINNGKDRIGLITERGGYKKFIHPAVCNRATLRG